MRLPAVLRLSPARSRPWRRIGAAALEVGLVALALASLESLGRFAADDAADVLGAMLLFLFGAAWAAAARSGRAPLGRRAWRGGLRGAQALWRRVEPPAGVAFRLPEEPPPRPWQPRAHALVLFAALVASVAVAGAHVPEGLLAVRAHLGYVPYLVLLFLLWGIFGVATTLGLLALRPARSGDRRGRRVALGVALWGGGILALAATPGWVPVAVFFALTLVASAPLLRRPPGRYWLWRRDAHGTVRSATVHAWLAATWLATVLALAFVVLLAQMPRLRSAVPPVGRFGITTGLGLAATAAALVLLLRSARLLHRTLSPPGGPPELPLVRTLWWPRPPAEAAWLGAARAEGWVVADRVAEPPDGFDLVVGREGHARHFPPPADLPVEDAVFRLTRRFHVVKRREFFRRLEVLRKLVSSTDVPTGAGFLFCPHAWPVVGLIQDVVRDPHDESRALLGGSQVGPPYAAVFPPRLRRYLGEVLRALGVDLIYWEARVAWAPLRAALGILFECYDQGRCPVQERHFVGLTRARVLIQEAEDVDDLGRDPLQGVEPGPPPLRARVLVVRRDDGGREVEAPDRVPGSHRPIPQPV